jgi:phospholipid/cholesterol/gamma-HCH transport system permease protein
LSATAGNIEVGKKPVYVVKVVAKLGEFILENIIGLGIISKFFYSSIRWLPKRPFRLHEIIQQIEFVGNKSIFIIALSGLFTGMVFALQTYSGFHMLNVDTMIGPTVALALTRELGPVLTGLIVAGRAGAAMSAQIGTMRVTEQIDALEVMGINPKQYLVMPRIVACVIALPLLAAIFDFIGNLGSYFLSTHALHIDAATYLAKINLFTRPKDIGLGILKAGFFGLILSVVGTYKGFNCRNGARGVGMATNETVVISMILILVSDYFLSALIRLFFY